MDAGDCCDRTDLRAGGEIKGSHTRGAGEAVPDTRGRAGEESGRNRARQAKAEEGGWEGVLREFRGRVEEEV